MNTGARAIAIVGGGVTGWLLGAALVRRGIECDIYDTDPSAGFSSTRNQGWLHSGAFYVAIQDDPKVAIACRAGSRWFRQFAPEAVRTAVPAYYLFEDPNERQRVMHDCQQLGIFAQSLTDVEFNALANHEPMLQGQMAPLYALEVHDYPLDTATVLTKLSGMACDAGLRYRQIVDWSTLQISWQRPWWEILDGAQHAHSYDAVVLACGPNIPSMLDALLPTHGYNFLITKIPVLAVHDALSTSLLAIPNAVGAPQLVPFEGQNGTRGVTICLYRKDIPTNDPNDDTLPHTHGRDHANALGDMYRGVLPITRGNQPQAHFYICHKLSLRPSPGSSLSRTHILLSLSPDRQAPNNLFALYPGKFTATPVAVNACLREIGALLRFSRRVANALTASGGARPAIAAQAYYPGTQHQTVRLTVNSWNRLLIS